MTHDESTCYSGEQRQSRWTYSTILPFYKKDRGQARMLSYFLSNHKYSSIFELDDDEWNAAIKEFSELNDPETNFQYDLRSANAFMEPGKIVMAILIILLFVNNLSDYSNF